MAYTFGGAVGSRCSWTISNSAGASANLGVVTGWWYPTTLTATRRYWGAGAVFGARVATTTSEIEMLTDHATTDGVRTTSGAGIAVNNWYFLAWIWAVNNSGPTHLWRCYLGTPETAPTELTVNLTTAGSGNLTGNTTAVFGNTSASNVSFQGDIADCSLFTTPNAGTTSPLGIAVSTALTQTEADRIRDTYILPMWAGNPGLAVRNRPGASQDFNYWRGNNGGVMLRYNTQGGSVIVAPAMTSATFSANGSPRPVTGDPLFDQSACWRG